MMPHTFGVGIRAVTGDLVQTREIRRSYGYMGSNELGLGDYAQVDTLQVHWPSDVVQTLLGVEADQRIVIWEDR